MPVLSQDLWSGETFPLRSRKSGSVLPYVLIKGSNPKFEGNFPSRPTYTGGTMEILIAASGVSDKSNGLSLKLFQVSLLIEV